MTQPSDLPALRKRLAEFMEGVRFEGNWPGWYIGKRNYYDEVVGAIPEQTWHPDQDISQAFMVAQRICQPGIYMEMELWERVCRARFRRHEMEPPFSLETTASLAISLAADAWLREVRGD